ncbi:EcsC family protein [Clostridium sp. MCC353]|nr:EcsC family protein [Clostridium sp. MCC353]
MSQEEKMRKTAEQKTDPAWKKNLEQRIPPKVQVNLQKAFCTAFSVVFEQGEGLIGKTFNRETILEDYSIQDYAVQVKGSHKQIKNMRKKAGAPDLRNLAITTAEGIGLGALGIGIPDIVFFTGFILKGVYETSLHYGYDYMLPEEKLLILKLLEAALAKGEDWNRLNGEVDSWMEQGMGTADMEQELKAQMKRTADAFALDMLLMKFIQGLPLVGVLGGVGNPVYYKKIMKYVRLKYQKRYVLNGLEKIKKDQS